MSDITDWLTAIGTVGAVVTALYFSTRDGRRAAQRERRHQADLVTAWIENMEGTTCNIKVTNASPQPVYYLVVSLVAVQGAFRKTAVGDRLSDASSLRTLVGLVTPGTTWTTIQSRGGAMNLRFGVEVAFQDTAGVCWLRTGQGKLKEENEEPASLYNIPEPANWERL
jgi:hypothetical protein